jgi:hypothetical protein
LPFRVKGFAEETEVYLELISLTFLAILLLVVEPSLPPGKKPIDFELSKWTVAAAVGIAVGYTALTDIFPWILRYEFSATFDTGRRSFSYYAFDISTAGFVYDEIETFANSIILALLWVKWESYRVAWREYLSIRATPDSESAAPDLKSVAAKSQQVSSLFNDWQLNSLMLAGAFLPWSYFDWSFSPLGRDGDVRYIYIALIDHLTWIGTWALFSVPLFTALVEWRRYKSGVWAAEEHIDHTDHLKAMLEDAEPIGSMQLFGASIAAAAAFLLPLLNLLK